MSRHLNRLSLAVMVIAPTAIAAQGIDRRVAAAPDGPVQFHFAARDGVCGNGKSFMRTDDGGYYSSFSSGDGMDASCAKGPVRVVVVRAGKEIVRIETYAGPLFSDPNGGQDLGVVPARDASSYLLGLVGSLEGRPASDALRPAMYADSSVVTPQLLQMAKDQARSRNVRSSAISWLSRRRSEPGGVGAAAVSSALNQIVRDRNESESLRQSALSTINNMDRGEGIPVMIGFASDADTWISKSAFQSLAHSSDPRARQFVRDAIRRTDLPEESRATAIQGIGNDYATGADYKLLRDLYPSLNTDRERDAVISALANAGGSENSNWLLTLAKSPTETVQRRKRVIVLLGRSDDPRIKDALKAMANE